MSISTTTTTTTPPPTTTTSTTSTTSKTSTTSTTSSTSTISTTSTTSTTSTISTTSTTSTTTTKIHAMSLSKVTAVTCSAPGKVLLAGGYLVLEYPNVGLVVAADKRFYCTVTKSVKATDPQVKVLIPQNGAIETKIVVRSPQFHTNWIYHLTFPIVKEADGEQKLIDLNLSADDSNSSQNDFVEKTLRVVMAFIWQNTNNVGKSKSKENFPSEIEVLIRADNDFYTVVPHLEERKWTATPSNVAKLPKFLPCPVVNGETVVNKTGLGSSAALVTSLVGALLESFGVIELPGDTEENESCVEADDSTDIRVAHNLAQICHCYAQGKVGSGFDVSSAIFGSHVYRRFPKCTLPDLLASLEQSPQSLCVSTAQLLARITNEQWKGGVQEPLAMPRGLYLLLADVCGGSESPSMARKVLAWKASSSSESCSYWKNLLAINTRITFLFKKLSAIDINLSQHAAILSETKADDWKEIGEENNSSSFLEITTLLLNLRKAFKEARTNLKAMGDAAGVPVEPDEQTALADATMELPGVLIATIPGAGGYDALACLYIGGPKVRSQIGEMWASWGSTHGGAKVCSLGVQSSGFGGAHGLCKTSTIGY